MPDEGDYKNLVAWASIFNRSTHLSPSPFPALTMESTIIIVAVTETVTPTTTGYIMIPPEDMNQISHSTHHQSSKSAHFMETPIHYLVPVTLRLATIYVYTAYNLLVLQFRLWQEWQLPVCSAKGYANEDWNELEGVNR